MPQAPSAAVLPAGKQDRGFPALSELHAASFPVQVGSLLSHEVFSEETNEVLFLLQILALTACRRRSSRECGYFMDLDHLSQSHSSRGVRYDTH